MTTDNDTPQLHEPLADLERHLMSAYVAGAGHNLDELVQRSATDEHARTLLADASRFASERLSEVESRLHYLQSLRGGA